MGPNEVPQEPTEEPQERLEGSALRPSQRIAFATLARTAGEAFAKLASLVFFIVIARELGEDDFGDFIFGASLATVLLMGAGVGMEELISRE